MTPAPKYQLPDFPDGLDGKASAYNVGDRGSIPGLGRSPGEGIGNPLQYSCLEKSLEQRSLEGYSPWGRNELDTTEHACTRANKGMKRAAGSLRRSLYL